MSYVFTATGPQGAVSVCWDGKRSSVVKDGACVASVLVEFDGDDGGLSCAIAYAGWKAGNKPANKEERDAKAREALKQAQEIIAQGRRKSHAIWLDAA